MTGAPAKIRRCIRKGSISTPPPSLCILIWIWLIARLELLPPWRLPLISSTFRGPHCGACLNLPFKLGCADTGPHWSAIQDIWLDLSSASPSRQDSAAIILWHTFAWQSQGMRRHAIWINGMRAMWVTSSGARCLRWSLSRVCSISMRSMSFGSTERVCGTVRSFDQLRSEEAIFCQNSRTHWKSYRCCWKAHWEQAFQPDQPMFSDRSLFWSAPHHSSVFHAWSWPAGFGTIPANKQTNSTFFLIHDLVKKP